MIRITDIVRSPRTILGTGALALAIVAAAAVPAASSAADRAAPTINTYTVTITNLTKGQPLSPPVLVTNYGSGEIFKSGRAASWGVQQVAENGNSDPLFASLQQDKKDGYVTDVVRSPTPLLPPGTPASAMFGKTITLTIKAKSTDRISWISMLGCTNDGFAGFNAARLPQAKGRTVSPVVGDYDAGTEENTEDFVDLTPTCQAAIGVKSKFGATGATATNWQLAEGGVVGRHAGVNGVSDDGLTEATHGWDPRKVAKVSITRID